MRLARTPSLSSRALHEELKAEGAVARMSEATGIHRTQLWRYATGRRKPNAEQIAKLHRATGGRVAADGWETTSELGAAE